MTSNTVEGQTHRIGMTVETIRTNTTGAIQIHSMTECTGILNVPGAVMKSVVRSSPVLRMRQIGTMTGFATVAANANIETRIGAGTAWFAMAGLAGGQVRLGVRAVCAATAIRAINGMRCSGTASVATTTIKALRGTARRCLVALQILSVTCLAGIRCVRRYITTVIGIWIRPC